MNCCDIREQLLRLERPDRPGPALGEHVQRCAACHRWLRRLARLERALPRLPVDVPPPPPSLFAALEASGELVRPHLRLHPEGRKEGGRRKLALASALAASLALFALGYWAWSALRPEPSLDAGAFRARIERRLAGAATPAKRAEALARLADDLLNETSADDAPQAERLAGQFEHLLEQALPFQAGELRGAALAPVLARLSRLESRAARLAAAHAGRIAAAYARMAKAARKAEQRLRA